MAADVLWRPLIGTIVSGKADAADVFFLLAVIVGALAAVLAAAARPQAVRWSPVAGWLAVALLGVAWLVL